MADLNYLKIRDKIFHLQVGDIITSNMEGYYTYYPSTNENLSQLPFTRWSRNTSIQITKKYHIAVEKAENIELIEEKPSHDINKPHLRHKKWKITRSIREEIKKDIDEDKNELYYIELNEDGFKYESEEIIKVTEKQIKLKKYLGSLYLQTFSKEFDVNVIRGKYNRKFVYCYFEDFEEFKHKLYVEHKNSLENALENAKNNLENFNSKMIDEGYEQHD